MAKPILTSDSLKSSLSYCFDSGVFTRIKQSKYRPYPGPTGYLNPLGYIEIGVNGIHYLAHRLAWLYVYGTMPLGDIDHINGNRSDNRIQNLRDVPHSVNIENQRGPRSDNKSGYMGVVKRKAGFQSSIRTGGVFKYLGMHATAKDAHDAYLAAKRQIHQGCTI